MQESAIGLRKNFGKHNLDFIQILLIVRQDLTINPKTAYQSLWVHSIATWKFSLGFQEAQAEGNYTHNLHNIDTHNNNNNNNENYIQFLKKSLLINFTYKIHKMSAHKSLRSYKQIISHKQIK